MITFKTQSLLPCIFFVILSGILEAQTYSFSGVFHKTTTPTQYWNNLTWESFTKKCKTLNQKGYQLIDFEGQHIAKGKSGRFWGIWQKTNIRTRIKNVVGWEPFKKLCMDQKADGYVLDDVESIINRNGNRIYIGLFSRGNKRQSYFKFRTMQDLKKQNAKYESSNGPTLVDVDQFTTNDGKNQYLAIYDDKGQGNKKTLLITSNNVNEFTKIRKDKRKAGWLLFDYEEFNYNGKVYSMGVFQKMKKTHSLWRNLNWHSFKANRSHMSRHRGMKLVDIELKKGKGKTFAPDTYTGKIKDTPDIWQHLPAYDRGGETKLFGSNSFCGPTAVSNGFMFWAKNGYSKLNPINQIDMVKELGDDDFMKSHDGTGVKGLVVGIRKYLKKYGYKLQNAYIYHIGIPGNIDDLKAMSDVSIKTNLGKIDLEKAHRSIINTKSTTLALWGYYEKDKKGNLKRTGGHYVTLVGYGQNESGQLNDNILIIHNPSTNPDKPKQEYLNITSLLGVDGISADTEIYKKKDGKKVWQDECKNKQFIKKKKKDGVMRYYILEGILDFRIR